MERLYPDSLGRILHDRLYQRLVHFCQQYTPEFPAEGVVHAWMQRFFAGDPSLIILVSLDQQYNITAHGVLLIQDFCGKRVLLAEQLEYDKPKMEDFSVYVEYVDKLAAETGSHCICLSTAKNMKVYERKYGYKTARTYMIKMVAVDGISDTAQNVN